MKESTGSVGSGKFTFLKAGELKEGLSIKGVYLKKHISPQYQSVSFLIETAPGQITGVPGSGALKKKFENIASGSTVELTYLGKDAIKKGQWAGTLAHNWKVLYAEPNEDALASLKASEAKAAEKQARINTEDVEF